MKANIIKKPTSDNISYVRHKPIARPVRTKDPLKTACDLYDDGYTVDEIARILEMPDRYHYLKRYILDHVYQTM